MARIKNESMTISKPCMGLFLQGGVKALSVVEAGVDVLLMIVGTIAIFLVILRTEFQNEMEAGSWKFYARIISWGYSYFYAFTCITLSHRLFSYASQRNTRGVYFCITIPGIMHIGCILNFGLYTVFVKWSQPAVMTAFLGYIFYKFYFFWVTISYFRDINRSGLLNPALRQLSDEEIEEFYYGSNPSEGSDKGKKYNKRLEISMENLFLDERHILGKGAFGIVYKGILTKPDGPTVVAIKTVVNTVDVSYFKVLLSELRVMTNLGVHPNIVNLVGAVTSNIENRKLWMVMEFCELGNVSSYLQNCREKMKSDQLAEQLNVVGNNFKSEYVTFSNGDEKVTSVLYSDLLKWSIQTASGMEFLGEKRIIHGDLSARNLLLTGTKDIKVSDFGLSRQLVYNSSLYVKKSDGPIPWKWMAPEALSDMNFSTSSDVYAFGITLWELFSYGEIPFSEWNYGKEFLDRLKCGDLFPEEPTIGGKDVYQVMMQCWKLDRRLRLSFTELKSIFLKMYNDEIRI